MEFDFFGDLLKQILEDRKLTVAWLSEETGIPATTLYSLIKRGNPPKADTLQKISTALGIATENLLKYKSADSKWTVKTIERNCIERGLTHAELAELSGIPEKDLEEYLKETKDPEQEILERIANALQISPYKLYDPEQAENAIKHEWKVKGFTPPQRGNYLHVNDFLLEQIVDELGYNLESRNDDYIIVGENGGAVLSYDEAAELLVNTTNFFEYNLFKFFDRYKPTENEEESS